MEVCQRSGFSILDVASTLQLSRPAAGDDDRQIRMVVHVRVPHAASVHVHRMVKQRAVAVPSGFQFVQEVGE